MEPEVFERFRRIIYDKSGIVLSEEKRSLLASRIQKRLRAKQLDSEAQYLEIVESDLSGEELVGLIDAISTNTTYFWREPAHFEALGEILAEYKAMGKSKLRIWCAASSTGQEPYILAMEVLEHFSGAKVDARILATDVSTKVLKIAQQGLYSDEEVSKLPADKLKRFFMHPSDPQAQAKHQWQVSPELQQLVLFKQLNLVVHPYPLKGPIDIIFCRNVLIYFDIPTRQGVIDECYRLLPTGGYMFLSLSESLLGIEHRFEKVSTSVYQKV
ncbi:MAG: chemotaxis protein CheR [Oligoflexia bacterium]|nr:chemotaxis protein CheR [Oligoflexia bacterium]